MNSALILDTNIVIYLYKNDSRAADYLPLLEGKDPCLSFMTLAELYLWPVRRNWSEARRAAFESWICRPFTVVPFDAALARSWAVLVGQTCRTRPISLPDSWIAATALHYRIPLVTHNRRHFEAIPDLQLLSES